MNDQTDWPAWVQAVGSVAAIFAGFAFVWWQQWQEKRSRAQTLMGLTSAVLTSAMTPAQTLVDDNINAESLKTLCRYATLQLNGARSVLFAVDFSPIGSSMVWVPFAAFVAALDGILFHLDDVAKRLDAQDISMDNAKKRIAGRIVFLADRCEGLFAAIAKHYRVKDPRAEVIADFIAQIRSWHVPPESTA